MRESDFSSAESDKINSDELKQKLIQKKAEG